MRRARSLVSAVLALVLVASSAGCAPFASDAPRATAPPTSARRLVVWMLSDVQPHDESERVDLERAIADVDQGVGAVDLAIVAGDLLRSGSTPADFDWLDATRARSRVPRWVEIVGNHDARNGALFAERVTDARPRSVEVGNLLFLLLSDESRASATEISDGAFRWWRAKVLEHPDRILVTVTHAQLAGSGLLASFVPSRTIRGSERFEEVLAEHPVALWASGHAHLPHWAPWTVHVADELGGTCFVNVSAIRDDVIGDSESRVLVLEDGSRELRIRSRNHTAGRFEGDDVLLSLDRPFRWDGSPPRVRVASAGAWGRGARRAHASTARRGPAR